MKSMLWRLRVDLPDVPFVAVLVIGIALLLAWYLTYTAARLDRLHAKVEGALTALDAQLIRRAEASLEVATSGVLDPASALLLADAASASLDIEDEHGPARIATENGLTEVLEVALDSETVARIRSDELGDAGTLDRLAAAGLRVQVAKRMHADAVDEVRRVRRSPLVRAFRLAGHTDLPEHLELDATMPPPLRLAG